MSFFALTFAAFFICLFFCWWLYPPKMRIPLLAIFNGYYALKTGSRVLLVLLAMTVLGWFLQRWVAKCPSRKTLWVSVVAILVPMAVYKYLPVFAQQLAWSEPLRKMLAPLGLSFYTFKSLSCLLEVYRGNRQPVTDPITYFDYIGFFPQLPQGPIQEPNSFFAALENLPQKLNASMAYSGCIRICWAFFLKRCLADPLSSYQMALVEPEYYYSLSMVWSLLFYALYLYFDFAAFSQMAIGLGELLGLPCAENFKSPYFSRSIGEFWHRWHISLSSFLQKYVYIPLGGSRNGTAVLILSTMMTFLLSGLWHGVTGGFVVWGLLHGFWLLCGRLTRQARERFWSATPQLVSGPVRSVLAWSFTMLLVVIGWFFFYAETIPHAMELLGQMCRPFSLSIQYVKESIVLLGFTPKLFVRRMGLVGVAACVDWCSREKGFGAWITERPAWFKVCLCYFCIFCSLFWGEASNLPGVYFGF